MSASLAMLAPLLIVALAVAIMNQHSVSPAIALAQPAGDGASRHDYGLAFTVPVTACDTLSFAPPVPYGVQRDPLSIALRDLNGDSHLDLAVANLGLTFGSVSILLGTGNGTFQPAINHPLNSNPGSLIAGDFNSDAVPDLAVANRNPNSVTILTGNGNGTFQLAESYPLPPMPAMRVHITLGDFNEDTDLDLALAIYDTSPLRSKVAILLGNGNGTFQQATDYSVAPGAHSVAVADFNGDTHQDVVSANTIGNVSILLGNGNGTFQASTNYTAAGGAQSVVVGHFNSDSHVDVATANNSPDSVSVLLGNGNGTLQPPVDYPVGAGPVAIATGDFNGDILLDLAVVSYENSGLWILVGNGNGTFQSAVQFQSGIEPYALATGDLNEDTHLDIAVANFNNKNIVSVVLNLCAPADSTQTPTAGATNTRTSTPTRTSTATIPASTGTPQPTPAVTTTPPPATTTRIGTIAATATAQVTATRTGQATTTATTQTTGTTTATATASPCAMTFTDVAATEYFYEPVRYLYCHGIISGYEDNTFRPFNNTTRSQMVKIVVLGFGIPLSQITTPTFADVPNSNAFFVFVETAAENGIVSGYQCGGQGEPCDEENRSYFRPFNLVTRGQLSKIVVVAAGWEVLDPTEATFRDVAPGTAFYGFVETANAHEVISGYSCGSSGEPCPGLYFRQYNNATRGQIAKIVYGAVTAP